MVKSKCRNAMSARSRPHALLVAATSAALACTGETGELGDLRFSYVAAELGPFDRPLAVGASLQLAVRTAGIGQVVGVTQVTTSDPAILQVASFKSANVRVVGMGPGSAKLTVAATDLDGAARLDRIALRVATIANLDFVPDCEVGTPQLWFPLASRPLRYRMLSAGGEALVGDGLVPLAVDPPSLATLEFSEPAGLVVVHTGGKLGGGLLRATTGAGQLAFEVIDPKQIDSIRLYDGLHTISTPTVLEPGGKLKLAVFAAVGGQPVCGTPPAFSATIVTPQICKVEVVAGVVVIDALAVGICPVTVQLRADVTGKVVKVGHTVKVSSAAKGVVPSSGGWGGGHSSSSD